MSPTLLLLLTGSLWSPQDTVAPKPVTYTIEATLDERAHVLRAQQRIEYRNVTGGELHRLYLHLYPNAFRDARTAFAREHGRLPWHANPLDWIPWGSRRGFMAIRALRVRGQAAPFTVRETMMTVPLATPLDRQDTLTIEIAFEVKLPVLQHGLGFRGTSYVMGQWFPKLAVADTGGWRGEGEPGEEAFYADAGAYDVRLRLPSDVVVAATGDRSGSTEHGDGTTTHRWQARHARYFGWVADRRYRVKRFAWSDVAVEYLFTGGHEASLEPVVQTVRAALDFYSARYGPYARRSLVIAEAPALGTSIAGVAFSQLIVLRGGLRAWPSKPLYEGVLAHEIAHQWWGGLVGIRDDRDTWLVEGVAEFAARDFIRQRQEPGARPRGELRAMDAVRRWEYLNQASQGFDEKVVQPGAGFDDLMTRAAVQYAKASFVFEMLQDVVGRDRLDSILRAYAATYRNRSARSADFIAIAESVSGRDLTWFFDRWLEAAATCDYSIEAVRVTAQPGAGYRSVITVKRNSGIVMPVEVEITLDDGTVLRRAWGGEEPSYAIVIESAQPVRKAVLDPNGRLLETARFNNFHPRKVGSSFLPAVPEDEAYHIVHLPLVSYDEGVELGLLLAGGRTPRLIAPAWPAPRHVTMASAAYNVRSRSPVVALAYAHSLGLLGRRAFWVVSASRDRARQQAAVSARAVYGPHLYRAPFHAVGVSLKHERRFEAGPEFDLGTVNSVQLGYTLRALVTDFYPIRGGVLAVDGEGGWKGLGSDWAFLRVAGQAEVYRRVLGGTKLALNLFGGAVVAGEAPRQKTLLLSREGNFRAGEFEAVAGERLTAFNGEFRVPLGTGTLFGAAAFVNFARYWGSGPEAARGLQREVGIGLRLFDNSSFAAQLDVPFWTSAGAGTERLDFARLSLRVGRPFRGPGS